MAAAVVITALVSLASIVKWGTSNKVTFGGIGLGNQTVQLFMVGIDGKDDVLIDTRTTIQNPAGNRGALSSVADSSAYNYSSTVAGGAVATDSGDGWVDAGRQYYIVLTTTQGGTEYKYMSSAATSSGLSDKALGSVSFTFNDTTSTVAGTKDAWVSAVPEPTSGLLLLLGVAGLALRRRRA